jgi:hypothetical protein
LFKYGLYIVYAAFSICYIFDVGSPERFDSTIGAATWGISYLSGAVVLVMLSTERKG